MENSLKSEYFSLLQQNSQNSLENFISRNGKSKAICPIRFIKKKEEDNKDVVR